MTLRIGQLARSPAPLLVAASLVAGCQPASPPVPSAPSSPDASSPETSVPSPSDSTSAPSNAPSNVTSDASAEASSESPNESSKSVASAEPSATAAVPSTQADRASTSDTATHDQPSVGERGAASEADRITASGAVEIIFEDIQLPIQADMVFRPVMLTERAKSLDGKRIRISGYMLPDSKSKNLKEFVLLKNTECKFGPGGQADHLLNVQLKPGTTTDFRDDAVAVEGVLKVNPFQGPDGNTWSIYDLECDLVEKFRPRR